MKIDISSSVQQTQTELNEKFFSIADPAFVFDLLRNKIYSNPILAVCRELCCNALDAHREVGKGDLPIEVHLPNYQESYFKVRDFGPGISPARMDDIYLKYAASTKRDSNDQIGAFGIGAKSPFSYSDSFTIITNFNGKCYNYMAFIDESRMGKLITLSESDTTEPNGTEIIVPVKSVDWGNFHIAFDQVTKHWSVKPKVNADSGFNQKPFVKVIDNGDWFTINLRESYYEKKIKILVGEIEYNLDNIAARSFCDLGILSAINSDIYLQFNVGELSLAANRESIYLDAATKQAIKDRMLKVKEQYADMVRKKINELPNFWQACAFASNELSEICVDPKLLGLNSIEWNGIPVKSNIIDDNFEITEFYLKTNWNNAPKVHHRKTGYVRFKNNTALIVHDCGSVDANSKHLRPFFDENPRIASFFVLKPKNQADESFDLEDFCNQNSLNLYGFELLSKHNKTIKVRKVSDKVKMMVYKYDPASSTFASYNITAARQDKSKKLICLLRKDSWRKTKYVISSNQEVIQNSAIKSAHAIDPSVSIYAFDENVDLDRVKSQFGDIERVEDYINNYLSSKSQEYHFETLWALDQYKGVQYKYLDNKFDVGVQSEQSPIRKLINLQKEVLKIIDSRKDYISTLKSFDKSTYNADDHAKFESWCNDKGSINPLLDEIKMTYPLIHCIDAWRFSEFQQEMVRYINLIDKDNNK